MDSKGNYIEVNIYKDSYALYIYGEWNINLLNESYYRRRFLEVKLRLIWHYDKVGKYSVKDNTFDIMERVKEYHPHKS